MVDTVNKEPDGTNEKDVNLDIAKDVQGDTTKAAGVTVKKVEIVCEHEKESTNDEKNTTGNEREISDGENESAEEIIIAVALVVQQNINNDETNTDTDNYSVQCKPIKENVTDFSKKRNIENENDNQLETYPTRKKNKKQPNLKTDTSSSSNKRKYDDSHNVSKQQKSKNVLEKKSGNNNEESKMKSVPNEKESTSVCLDTPVSLETITTYEDQIQSSVIPSFHWDVFFHKERRMQPWKNKINI